MRPEIEHFLAKIENAPLLENLGEAITDDRVVACAGWDEVRNIPLMQYFCDVQHQLGNEIIYSMPKDAWYEKCNTWTPLLNEIKPRIRAIQDVATSKLPLTGESLRWVNVSIKGGIVLACREIEYQEYTKSTFFRESAEWYLRGHLPCGWSDDFPAGKLVVF